MLRLLILPLLASTVFGNDLPKRSPEPSPKQFDAHLHSLDTFLGPALLEPRVLETFPQVSIGLMMEHSAPEDGMLVKRAAGAELQTRDLWREELDVSFDKRGDLVLHERDGHDDEVYGHLEKRMSAKARRARARRIAKQRAAKRHKHRKSHKSPILAIAASNRAPLRLASIPRFSAVITWYAGASLDDPFCGGGNWNPGPNTLVAAVTERWGRGRPKCGSFLQLRASNGKSIIVRVVDMCGGCKPGVDHVDLSPGAFRALYNLEIGSVSGVKVSTLAAPPFKSWNSAVTSLYGPKHL